MDVDVEAMLDAPYQEKRVSLLVVCGLKRASHLITFDRKTHMPLLTETTEMMNAGKSSYNGML